jgi:2,4-diaminopentanoate dehydrogenase
MTKVQATIQDRRYRVAQWATGHTGMNALRKIIEHPRYDLVGVYVYSDEKAGRDAGELSGTEPTGIVTTQDVEDIVAAKPDCVLYMPLLDHESIDDICRLLESGANVVTPVPRFYHPPSIDPEVRTRLEAACERGDTSLYGTGGAPDFITELFPLAVTILQRRLDRFSVVQYADVSGRQSPDFLHRFFGMDPATIDIAEMTKGMARTDTDGASLRQFADAVGAPLDDLVATAEPGVARNREELGLLTLEPGTIGAWRNIVTGLRAGKPFLEFSRTFYVTKDLDAPWEVRDSGWHVIVEGDAPLDIEIHFPKENYAAVTAGYNGHTAVNAVHAVCSAPSGIRTTDELCLVPYFG